MIGVGGVGEGNGAGYILGRKEGAKEGSSSKIHVSGLLYGVVCIQTSPAVVSCSERLSHRSISALIDDKDQSTPTTCEVPAS